MAGVQIPACQPKKFVSGVWVNIEYFICGVTFYDLFVDVILLDCRVEYVRVDTSSLPGARRWVGDNLFMYSLVHCTVVYSLVYCTLVYSLVDT